MTTDLDIPEHTVCWHALASRDRDIAELRRHIAELRGQVRSLQLASQRNDDLREQVKLQSTQILELQKVILRGARVKP